MENAEIINDNDSLKSDGAEITKAILSSLVAPISQLCNSYIESNERISRYKIETNKEMKVKEINLIEKISNREFIIKILVTIISVGIIIFYTIRGYDLTIICTFLSFIIASIFANNIGNFVTGLANKLKSKESED